MKTKKIPTKYQPKGFEILYDDDYVIVGNKAAGLLTVGALYERERTVHHLLNQYVRKGNSRSHKRVSVVHRLDRETSGLLVFTKSEEARTFLKENWKSAEKEYFAVVHGRMSKVSGMIESYLTEDEDYVVHSRADSREGRLSQTMYTVVKQVEKMALLKVDLLTGRKNQIRVHLAGEGHPIVGDDKYGKPDRRQPKLLLHARRLAFTHPHTKARMVFEAPVPPYFHALVGHF
ncbi:MAG: RluA family pseudouridine synthase [Candidatus Omnitrophica bacterium]|nr:RluA family pseudouridine synthase [Candidatus Omnitrophota bacterium]